MTPSDADRELSDLRARAYGPDADIDSDPAARARLVELEAARLFTRVAVPAIESKVAPVADAARPAAPVGVVADHAAPPAEPLTGMLPMTSSEGDGRSLWHRATATRRRRRGFIAVAIVAVIVLIYAITWLLGPHPDATQHRIAVEIEFADVLSTQGVSHDSSTLRQYEPYRDIKLWSVIDDRGYFCLAAWEQGLSGRFGHQCAPQGTELFVDLEAGQGSDSFAAWLPDDSFVRFQLRGAGVDVYLPPAPEAD
jgi:hypothetical protein